MCIQMIVSVYFCLKSNIHVDVALNFNLQLTVFVIL